MKKTISIAFAAFALLSFASCQKENLTSENQEPVLRTITATFENNGTKTILSTDNVTPLWKENDVIRVFGKDNDDDSYQDITLAAGDIKSGGKSITFTTTLTGTLYAVYPASVTTMTNCSGSIDFTIPANQDGTFASANICVAKSSTADGTNNDDLVFSNATSILEFSQGSGSSNDVLRVAVTAANAIAGKLTATFGDDNKANISTSGLTGKVIWTTAAATAQGKYYVAIAPVGTGDISFNYYKAAEEKSESKTSKTLERNKIYELAIPAEGYADSYVTIGSKKWAKYNLGATTVAGSYATCYGDLYEWGSVETIYTGFPYTSATAGSFTWKTGKSSGYSLQTYCGNSSFSEWSTPPHDNTKLKAEYDVATVKLGTGWRMPTKDDFTALANACKSGGYSSGNFIPSSVDIAENVSSQGIYYCSNYSSGDGIKGLLFCDGTNKLFFPAAGFGNGTSLSNAGSYGYYWSSSLNTSTPRTAYDLVFYSSKVFPQNSGARYSGFSVRPVSDE